MILSKDTYGNLKDSQLFLANPQGNYIGVLNGVKDLKFIVNANSLSELSFNIYEYEDGERNEYYDLILDKRLIELQYIGWFQIQEPLETHDEDSSVMYKNVTCFTIENELINKIVDNIVGVYSLYDVANQDKSLLHIIMKYCNWKVNHIDPELLGKYRNFSIDSSRIYTLLNTDVAESFGCVFQFDTYTKEINAFTIENFGKLTNITISNKNILKQFSKSSNGDNIITKIRVKGAVNSDGTQFDIRAINPDGSTEIIDVSFYKVPFDPITKEGWMTQGLVDALDSYQLAYDSYATQYSTILNTLKQYQGELTVLESELVTIQTNYNNAKLLNGSYVDGLNGRTPTPSDSVYTLYQQTITDMDTYQAQKNAKQSEIANKKIQINNTTAQLDDISFNLDINSYFTQEQLVELDSFIMQGDDYIDDTFIATDTMTEEEIIESKLELKANAEAFLSKVSRPQFTIETTLNNLYSMIDNAYDDWQDDCQVGNLITLFLRDDYWITVRLMSIEFDFNNLSDIKLVFSDKTRMDDKLTQLAEVIGQANRTSSSFSIGKYMYNKAADNISDLVQFRNGIFNATLNRMVSNANEEIEIDEYGLRGRRWLQDQNKYSDKQLWLNSNVMMFSNDGFRTANSAFGLLVTPTGEEIMGINTDYLIGKVVISENLFVENASGNYTINDNGFNASATVGGVVYSAGFNPSVPTEIINVKVNGVNKFYIDTANNRLVFSGHLSAASGTFSGSLSAATGTFSGLLSGGSINIGNNRFTVDANGLVTINSNGLIVNSTNFKLTADGTMTCINGNFIGNITGGTMNINNAFTVSNTGDLYASTAKFGGGDNNVTIDSNGLYIKNNSGVQLSRMWINGFETSFVFCDYLTVDTLSGITVGSNSLLSALRSNLTLDSTSIIASDTGYGNINLQGFDNAAGVNWVQANFQTKTASDLRLKKNINSLSDISDEIYMQLKPKQFEYKLDSYPKGVCFGLVSQQVENLFSQYGLDPNNYNLFDITDVRKYTDDGQYVSDKTHRLNYINLITLNLSKIQNLYKIVQNQDNIIGSQKILIDEMKLEINNLKELISV
jgi:hypothetical protein